MRRAQTPSTTRTRTDRCSVARSSRHSHRFQVGAGLEPLEDRCLLTVPNINSAVALGQLSTTQISKSGTIASEFSDFDLYSFSVAQGQTVTINLQYPGQAASTNDADHYEIGIFKEDKFGGSNPSVDLDPIITDPTITGEDPARPPNLVGNHSRYIQYTFDGLNGGANANSSANGLFYIYVDDSSFRGTSPNSLIVKPDGTLVPTGGIHNLDAPAPYTLLIQATNPGTPNPPTNFTWTGSNSALWSDPGNWLGNQAPAAGQPVNLTFPAGVARTHTSEDIPGLVVGDLQINGDYSISGFFKGSDALKLTKSLAVNELPGRTSIMALPVVLEGNVVVYVGVGEADFTGGLYGTGGIVFVGPGTLGLGSASAYSGNTVLAAGTLKVQTDASAGVGILELRSGTLTTAGAPADVTLPNAVVSVEGSVTVLGNPGKPGPALNLKGNLQVTQSSVLALGTVLRSLTSLSVHGTNTLAILPFPGLNGSAFLGSISGHVSFTAIADKTSASYLGGTLSPGARVDVLKGATVTMFRPLTGNSTCALNIAGGNVTVHANQTNLQGYSGLIVLQPGGTIETDTSLGTGPLVLMGGTLRTSTLASVGLDNSQTTLGGDVEFRGLAVGNRSYAPQLMFVKNVVVSRDITAGLFGPLDLAGNGQARLIFSGGIRFGGETTILRVTGEGVVSLPTLTPQVRAGDLLIKIGELGH